MAECNHIMLLWISTCEMIHNGKVLPACKVAVHDIIRHISLHKTVWTTLSVSNLLQVLTIITTAILTMYATCSALLHHEGNVYMPSSYQHVVSLFRNMINPQGSDSDDKFFRSCIEDVKRRRDISQLPLKLQNLLLTIMNVVTGLHHEGYNPLKYTLSNENCLINHEAQHFSAYMLTLFGNMALILPFSDSQLQRYRARIYDTAKHCPDSFLKEVYDRFATTVTVVGNFGAMKRLLEASKDSLVCMNLYFNRRFNSQVNINFNEAQLMKIHQRRLLPISVENSASQQSRVTIQHPPASTLRATANEFIPQTFSTSSSVTQQFTTQDSREAEDPEIMAEVNQAIESEAIPEPKLPTGNLMVDENFCRICARGLVGDSDSETTPSNSGSETYAYHIHTEEHITKSEIYKYFNTEEKDYYNPKTEAIRKQLSQSVALYDKMKDSELQRMIEGIKRELKDADDEVYKIRQSAEWSVGVKLLQDELSGKLKLLHMKLKRTVEESEKKWQELEEERKKDEKEESQEVNTSEEEEEEIERMDNGEKFRKSKRMKTKIRRERQNRLS